MSQGKTQHKGHGEERHFHELIRSFDHAMLTTHGRDGSLHARPMIVAEIDEDANVWLMSDVRAEKVEEVGEDARASVTMQSDSRFATLCGKTEVVRDTARMQRLWNASWQTWFPEGPTDQNLVLLKVQTSQGEFWDNAGVQGAKYLYRAATAYVKGERPKLDSDVHAKVALQ